MLSVCLYVHADASRKNYWADYDETLYNNYTLYILEATLLVVIIKDFAISTEDCD